MSELLFIRFSAIVEALTRTLHCQALTIGSPNSQPWVSQSSTLAASMTTVGPF